MLIVGIYGPGGKGSPSDTNSSYLSHDHGMAFMRNGKVIEAIELERYTGVKHDNRISQFTIELIEQVWDGQEDIQIILVNSCIGNSFSSDDKNLIIEAPKKMALENILEETCGKLIYRGRLVDNVRFYVMFHEFAHIASVLPFSSSFDENSLLIHIDGGASVSCFSAWFYDGRKIQLLEYGWHTLKQALNNFNDNILSAWILEMPIEESLAIPGKLMGLAAWGQENPSLYSWLEKNNWFSSFKGSQNDFLLSIPTSLGYSCKTFSTKERFCQDIAFCFQSFFEISICSFIYEWLKKTNTSKLYYSGGAALNIITNSKIENELDLETFWIPPATNDSGLALGAAAYMSWMLSGPLPFHTPYLNTIYSKKSTAEFTDFSCEEVADLIEKGKIIAFIHGHGEIGPRALGNRSLLARLDSIDLRKKLSESVKQREWYRPVAPIVLKNLAPRFFKRFNANSNLAQYMLGCWEVKEEYLHLFSGVIHADNSVRVQIIDEEIFETRFLSTVLSLLWNKYGIAGVINTSLNLRGKPIFQGFDLSDKKNLRERGVDDIVFVRDSIGK